jgi:CBS domain containing-hemolysin-like protein
MKFKFEIVLVLFLILIVASAIFIFYVMAKETAGIENKVNLNFEEKSIEVLNQDVIIPGNLNILTKIFFGIENSIKIYEFVVIIASFFLFFIFFTGLLELTNLKPGLNIILGIILTLASGFFGLIKIAGLAVNDIFSSVVGIFLAIILTFIFFIVFMWAFSLILGKIKSLVEEEKLKKGEIRVKRIKQDYKL